MRKIAVLLLCILAAALLLCGCGDKAEADAPAEATLQATLAASPIPSPVPTAPSPSPAASPVPSPAPTPFRMVWISDTQSFLYYDKYKDVFPSMTFWIFQQARRMNIQFVVHTGDMMDNGFKDWQAQRAEDAVQILYGRVPFLAVAGNHDMGVVVLNYSAWLKRSFVTRVPEECTYGNGRGVYGLFSAGGTDFVVAGVGFSVSDRDATDWLKGVFDRFPNRVGILFTHSYLNSSGRLSPDGLKLDAAVTALCPNVRLVLCGHNHNIVTGYETFDDDKDGLEERTVALLLVDYQEQNNDSPGYLTILTFDPVTRSIGVDAYSPYLDDYILYDDQPQRERFTIENGF